MLSTPNYDNNRKNNCDNDKRKAIFVLNETSCKYCDKIRTNTVIKS